MKRRAATKRDGNGVCGLIRMGPGDTACENALRTMVQARVYTLVIIDPNRRPEDYEAQETVQLLRQHLQENRTLHTLCL